MDSGKLIQDIVIQIRYIPRAFLLAVLLAIAYLFFRENGVKVKDKLLAFLKQRWLSAFVFYLAFILTGTLLVRQNTEPYLRIFENFGLGGNPVWDKEIIENILLFIPYTFFYLMAFRSKPAWKAALRLSVITSAAIEICQLLFWLGSFQPADLFHNMIGGMIGCGIWYMVERIRNRKPK